MNHFYFDYPGWFAFHDVYDRAVAQLGRDGAHFVEVGCWEGRSAAYMGVNIVNSGFDIRFDCVDTWEGSKEHVDEAEKAELYDKFVDGMSNFNGELDYRVIRKESTVAAADYADKSLDFVFLDASHEPENVAADIEAWLPKIQPDGVLAGDDVAWEGVRMALLRNGLGLPEAPLVMSGGVYKSWILTPKATQQEWITPVPKETDNSSMEGYLTTAAATIEANLPSDVPPGCISGHKEEFRERISDEALQRERVLQAELAQADS